MNDLSELRLQVLIDGAAVPARVLVELKQASALGLAELRSRIASGVPVLDIEMFTNDWYDNGATRLLELLSNLESHGVGFILLESLGELDAGRAAGGASRITLAELRNIVGSGQEIRARFEEIDDHRSADSP